MASIDWKTPYATLTSHLGPGPGLVPGDPGLAWGTDVADQWGVASIWSALNEIGPEYDAAGSPLGSNPPPGPKDVYLTADLLALIVAAANIAIANYTPGSGYVGPKPANLVIGMPWQ